jgi:hypothetical protein
MKGEAQENSMADRTEAPERLFDERRQAYGWLAWTWSIYLTAILVLAQAAYVMWTGGPAPSPLPGISFALVVALVALWIWGWRARRDVSAEEARALAEERGLRSWGMSTFTIEGAAERLGWSPTLAAWINRVLITLVNVLGMIVAVLIVWVLVD